MHLAKFCTSVKEKFPLCGKEHGKDYCDIPKERRQDAGTKECPNCGGEHHATFRGCEYFIKEKVIVDKMVELEVPRYRAKQHLREEAQYIEDFSINAFTVQDENKLTGTRFYRDALISEENNKETEIEELKKVLQGNHEENKKELEIQAKKKDTEIEQLKKLLIANHEESQKQLQEMKNLVQENNKEAEIEQLKEMLKENHDENRKEIEELKTNCMKMFKCITETIFTNNRSEEDKKQIIYSAMSRIYKVKGNEDEKQETQDIEETKAIEELLEARNTEDHDRALEKLNKMVQDNTEKTHRLNRKIFEELPGHNTYIFTKSAETLLGS